MARIAYTAVLIALLNILVGCQSVNSGTSRLVPERSKLYGSTTEVRVDRAGEADIVEQLAINREAYRLGLDSLVKHYSKVGDNEKFKWAKRELDALDAIPQYKYILEAEVAGPNLKASISIPEANVLFEDGKQLQREAQSLLIITNNDFLRLALDRYDLLIKRFPTSDKIDDAAYEAGQIYESFRDYSIALLYYQRAYEWDPDTIHPARFRAARILDKRLHRYDEALELYKMAVKEEGMYGEHDHWRRFAEQRIVDLYGTGDVEK
ncbi:MAG: hypothetical protein PVH77_03920 [Phycisphaerales bacterium]|jgi:tetratricopeptide (TPR) repeat protein